MSYYAHLGAQHLLSSCGLLAQLHGVLTRLPVPHWQGKSSANDQLCVVQQVLNSFIEYELTERGWLSQAQVGDAANEFYADFWASAPAQWQLEGLADSSVQALCEVQFGNVGRLGMDIEKFRVGHLEGRCDVGIEIVPTRALAHRVDGSVATFEKACGLVQRLGRAGLPIPLLVVGLDTHPGQPELDLRTVADSLDELRGKRSAKRRAALAASLLTSRP